MRIACKWLLTLFLTGLFSVAKVYAQEVRVTGSGTDREAALQNALLLAVSKVNGVVLYGRSTVEKDVLVEDRITQTGFGFIKAYRVLTESTTEDGVLLEIWADVQERPVSIQSRVQGPVAKPDVHRLAAHQQVAAQQLAFFTHRYGNLRDVLNDGYRFSVKRVEIDSVAPGKVTGAIVVELVINQGYWIEYLKTVEQLAVPGDINTGIFLAAECLAIEKGYRLPDFLAATDIPPLYVRVDVGGFNRDILLIKNSAVLSKQTEMIEVNNYLTRQNTPHAQITYELDSTFLCKPWPNHKEANEPLYTAMRVESMGGYLYTDVFKNGKMIGVSASYGTDPTLVFEIPFQVDSARQVSRMETDVRLSIVR